MIDRLRLDRPGTDFLPNSPHVILETRVNTSIASNAKIPRSTKYGNGDPNEFVADFGYPYTGNGIPASRDGHVLPEFTTASTAMDAGLDGTGQPYTVMRFRFDDGTPYPQTVNIDGVPITASDWKLIVNPDNDEFFKWTPIP
ncbi:MAG: hypothetical protein Q9O74_07235 [Planctomycetota bacterium]|nr:hypothetical protein [Planctomycetota bacterium]